MARYKLKDRAYCRQTPADPIEQIWQAGTEIETDDAVIPGPHMEPLDDAAKKAMAKYKKEGAPLDMDKVRELNLGVQVMPGAALPGANPVSAEEQIRLLAKAMTDMATINAALLERLAAA